MEEEKSKVGNLSESINQVDAESKSSYDILTMEQLQLGEKGRKEDLSYYIQMLSNFASMRREIDTSNNIFCRELKSKIEKIMDLTPSEMPISKILSQILSDAVTFDGRHSKLIELLIDSLKDLVNSDTPKFCTENGAKVISEIIVDFLLRIKDKHPFSDLIEGKIMNVLNVVLEFVCEYSFKPSAALFKEYAESKFTKELNTLPTRELLNSKFDERSQIYEERYKLLKKRFESRPPFVYYFNPDIEMEVKVCYGFLLKIGFFEKGTDTQIGTGMYLYNYGNMFQGYFKNDSRHLYGREIWADGDIYEGGLHMGDRHGKGKYEHYENGRVEICQWVKGIKHGEFECYDKSGTLIQRKIFEDGEEIKSEEVKDEMQRLK